MRDAREQPYNLQLGPVTLELRTQDSLLSATLKERYGGFFATDVDTTERASRGVLTLTRKPFATLGDPYETHISIEPHSMTLASAVLDGRFNLDRGVGTLSIHAHPRFGAGVYLENALRQIVQVLAVERQAFLLHSAAIAHPTRNSVQVFVGKSGSGKTTISELLRRRGSRVLSDDLVMVDCQGTVPRLISTPFFGTLREAEPVAGLSGEIEALNFLKKSSRAQQTPITNTATSLAMALTNVPFAEPFDRSHRHSLLEHVARLVEVVPVRQLSFRKDLSFLSHIGWSDLGPRDSHTPVRARLGQPPRSSSTPKPTDRSHN